MCFETTARPPFQPNSGGAGISATDELTLSSADGTKFSAFLARTALPAAPGMVILPDVRGLHPFYKDLAERFAEAGVHATALDYFGRTAGIVPRGDDLEFMPHVHQTKPEAIAQDVAATVVYLRSRAGGAAEAVYTVGFCFGGRNSFNQAARGHGSWGCSGAPTRSSRPGTSKRFARRWTTPA